MLNVQMGFDFSSAQKAIDKIQDFQNNASADVLVGFLSGKQHVPTLHKDENKNYVKPARQWENAELAKMLSFGAGNIPARPFLEDGINSQNEKITKTIKEQLERIRMGYKANWDKVGTMAVGAVQEYVRGDFYKTHVPNSPETIAHKGSDTPLIDGADLINSVEYVIE